MIQFHLSKIKDKFTKVRTSLHVLFQDLLAYSMFYSAIVNHSSISIIHWNIISCFSSRKVAFAATIERCSAKS